MYRIDKTNHFDKWFIKLKDTKVKAKIIVRLKYAELGNFGDYKSIGKGLKEFRFIQGPGYRIYFKQIGDTIIILLNGGDKSSQSKDIAKANEIWKEIEVDYEN
jgi:putative addiction module killer protein